MTDGSFETKTGCPSASARDPTLIIAIVVPVLLLVAIAFGVYEYRIYRRHQARDKAPPALVEMSSITTADIPASNVSPRQKQIPIEVFLL